MCFSGPKGELPAGDTTYGTSVPWGKAIDPANDILIAYKQVSWSLDVCVWVCVRVCFKCYVYAAANNILIAYSLLTAMPIAE